MFSDEVLDDLLMTARQATFFFDIIEEVCGCLKEIVWSSRDLQASKIKALSFSLPTLFASSDHPGFLYVSSGIVRIFRKQIRFEDDVHELAANLLELVVCKLEMTHDLNTEVDLVAGAFSMAKTVVKYCPDALDNFEMVLNRIMDIAVKGKESLMKNLS